MLYTFLKCIVQISVPLFFRKIRIEGKEHLTFREPCIIASNHPNTLLDALVIARMLRQPIYFLANASLFDTAFKRWVMYAVNMIPIYRKQDIEKTGTKVGNRSVFLRCFEFLNLGRTILIFPEGTSIHERHLREIKTGVARIAFGAETHYDFDLNVKIIPIGLNYTDPTHFFGDLYIQIGQPISLEKYKELYQRSSRNAIHELTEEIRKAIDCKVINAKNKAQDLWIQKIETHYKKRLAKHLGLSVEDVKHNFLLTQNITSKIKYVDQHEPEKLAHLQTLIQSYETQLKAEKIRFDTSEMMSKKEKLRSQIRLDFLQLLFGFPLFLYGFFNNIIPYLIPSKIASKIVQEIEYRSSVILVFGVISFTAFYTLQIALFFIFINQKIAFFFYVLSLIPSGYFALFYHQKYERFLALRRLYKVRKNPEKEQAFIRLQTQLFCILDELIDKKSLS